ncbi:AraC family transcriptional regulator N-terminal domain-containing protein [Zobellella sp. DQSA1]|uniref:AraC family transcriptional regulator n=1 Tax=Zobellella sp. DQSA1 TaxID=3342386 RepID=UPI0035C24716
MPFSSDLAAIIVRHALAEGANETAVAGLVLYRGGGDIPRQPVIYKPSICVVAQGRKRLFLGEESYRYDPNNYLINSLTLPIEAEVSGGSPQQHYLGLSLEIDPELVGNLILQMDQYQDHRHNVGTEDIIAATPLSDRLRQAFARLIELGDAPMDRDILCDSIKREIFYEVLKGPRGDLLRNCVRSHRGANRIAPVVHFIEQNFHRPLDIDVIADVAQMSTSSLHEHFKAVTSLAPMQFVKNLRLHRARALLLSGAKASEACYQVGYGSPSQFSREFRRLFGHPPKEVQAPNK